ncbi:hypothetical protein BH23ACT3_BH23ACT3_19100 [soil metagenome]
MLAAGVSLPIVLAAVRGVRRGYLPIGDNALIEMRARDVLTAHHPWLGTWSSASISSGIDVNHPGPLIFDVLALPVRLLGAGPGIAFGVAALQVGVVFAIGWCADRIGGRATATAVLAVTAVLVWSIGSELLYDPWQPNLLMLPFLLLLVLVWGVVAGRHLMLPWAVLVASFCVQTHLSYVFLAPAVLVVGAAMVGLRRDPRPLVVGAAVGLLAWSQPILEQVFGSGRGNLSRLAASGGGGEGTRTGLSLGIRLVSAVVALPPWFTRSGVMDTIPVTQWSQGPDGPTLDVPGLAGVAVATLGLVVFVGLVALVTAHARRRGDTVVTSAVVVFGAALTVALVTVVITPIDVLGLSPHKIRWLWPLAAFGTLVLAVAAVRVAPQPRGDRRVLPGAFAVAAAVFAAATVPFHAPDAGPVGYRGDIPRIRELTAQLDVLSGRGTVLFDATGLYFAEPFTAAVMAGLQRAGVPFVLDEEGLVRQLGERRRSDGSAELRVFVREGSEALVVPSGVERVAFRPALDQTELAELGAFEQRLADWRRTDGPGTDQLPPDATLDDLGSLAAAGGVDLAPALGDEVDRFVHLDQRWRGLGVAVFAEPLR